MPALEEKNEIVADWVRDLEFERGGMRSRTSAMLELKILSMRIDLFLE